MHLWIDVIYWGVLIGSLLFSAELDATGRGRIPRGTEPGPLSMPEFCHVSLSLAIVRVCMPSVMLHVSCIQLLNISADRPTQEPWYIQKKLEKQNFSTSSRQGSGDPLSARWGEEKEKQQRRSQQWSEAADLLKTVLPAFRDEYGDDHVFAKTVVSRLDYANALLAAFPHFDHST